MSRRNRNITLSGLLASGTISERPPLPSSLPDEPIEVPQLPKDAHGNQPANDVGNANGPSAEPSPAAAGDTPTSPAQETPGAAGDTPTSPAQDTPETAGDTPTSSAPAGPAAANEPLPATVGSNDQSQPLALVPNTQRTDRDKVEPATWELADDDIEVDIPLDLVDDSPFQPEDLEGDRYGEESITLLAHTLASEGQKDPIQVRRIGKRFELIAGHRRVRAMRQIPGRKYIRGIIKRMTDEQADRAVLVHNQGRKDDCDFKRARAFRRALDRGYAKGQSEVARMFATTQGTVSKCLGMLRLPAPILALLEKQPNLFAMNTSLVIHELVETYPGELDLIVKGVTRIRDDKADENSVKSWVMQMIQAKDRKAIETTTNDRPKVITDHSGRQLASAKLEGRVITVRLSSPDVSAERAMQKLVEHLQSQEFQTDLKAE